MNKLRSLVGMTMGARKRAARYACVRHQFRKSVKLTWFKCWSRDYHARVPTADDVKTNQCYQYLRELYRIGYKLRTCTFVGCKNGMGWCQRCDGWGVITVASSKASK